MSNVTCFKSFGYGNPLGAEDALVAALTAYSFASPGNPFGNFYRKIGLKTPSLYDGFLVE